MKRGIVAWSTAVALLCTPSVQAAGPAGAAVDPLAAAKSEHAHGQALFDTADYAGAITAWTKALEALPPKEPKSATYRPLILYNVAAAREKLFELRGDVTELRQAKILLERFDASIDEIYGHDPVTAEAERSRVREKIAALDARIAATLTPDEPAVVEPVAEPQGEPTLEPIPTKPVPRSDRGPAPPSRGLMIGGGVMVGLGAGALAGLVATLVIGKQANDISGLEDNDMQGREDQFARGGRANAAAIAMGIVAPLLLGAGVALLVVGSKRRSARVSAAPSLGRHGVAWVLIGRF